MAYADILAKEAQKRGYRLRIEGIRYYFTSHADVPTLTDPAGGSLDYVRVEGAIKTDPMPRTLPQKAHPLKKPEVTSITVNLLDVDGRCTEIWATEQESPQTNQTWINSPLGGKFYVEAGPLTTGIRAFDSSGVFYTDRETIEYGSKTDNAGTYLGATYGTFNSLTTGKYHSTEKTHTAYQLIDNTLPREVYGFIPHLHFRECVLEVFDLENTSNSAEIARGFLQEPYYDAKEEVFRLRILNYIHPLQQQVFKRTECKGRLSRDFSVQELYIADPRIGLTELMYIDAYGTQEVDPEYSFFKVLGTYPGRMPTANDKWMPKAVMFMLVGGDDGEIIGYTDWDQDPTDGEVTVALRGCFGTPVGKDGRAWPKGTPIQHLCVLAGDPTYQTYAAKLQEVKVLGATFNYRRDATLLQAQYAGGNMGVNPVEAILMLLTSIDGDETNGDYDLLPPGYGLGIDDARIDITAFETFRDLKCSTSEHVYIAKEPVALLDLIHQDLQMLYGGMVYATYDGTITITEFRDFAPNDDVTTIAQADIPELDSVGVQDVYNTLKVELDRFPSQQKTTENAYDYRKRDALGESPAPSVVSQSLRGPGFRSVKQFGGVDIVRNQVVAYLELLGNGAPFVTKLPNAHYLHLQPGNFIKFTHNAPPQLIANARGFSGQLAMIMETEGLDDEAKIRTRSLILQQRKTSLWAPSAEILARTSDTAFTIKANTFSTSPNTDRDTNYWDTDTKIRVWNAAMTDFDQCTIATFTPATGAITLDAPGSAYVQDDNRITWDDWDECRDNGGSTQQARCVVEEWYGFHADANHALGSDDDSARIWM